LNVYVPDFLTQTKKFRNEKCAVWTRAAKDKLTYILVFDFNLPHLVEHVIEVDALISEVVFLLYVVQISLNNNKHVTPRSLTPLQFPKKAFISACDRQSEVFPRLPLNMGVRVVLGG